MKRNYILKYLAVFCVLSCFLGSCNSGIDLTALNDNSIKFDESLVLPVAEVNMTVKDLLQLISLPQGVDTAANEIFFQWKYDTEIALNTVDMVSAVPPFENKYAFVNFLPLNSVYPLPIIGVQPIFITGSFDLGVNKNVADQRVDSAMVHSSQIDVKIDVSPDLAIYSPSIFKIEFVFNQDTIKVKDGVMPTVYPTAYGQYDRVNIGEYTLYPHGDSILPYKIKITIDPTKQVPYIPIFLQSTSYLTLNMKFSDVKFEKAYGFFNLSDGAQKTIPVPFDIKNFLPSANLKFANPIIEVSTTTNVGADIIIKAEYMSAYNDANPSEIIYAMFNNRTNKNYEKKIKGPKVLGTWLTAPLDTFDTKNGWTDQVFDKLLYPNMLDYIFSIASDPTRTQNFITPDAKIKINLKVKLPLKVKGGINYAFSDTIKTLNLGTTLDVVDSAILVLKLKNGLPVKANYRMTCWKSTNANDTVIAVGGPITHISDNAVGNMFSEYEIKSPPVDAEGTVKVSQIAPQTIAIMLNKSQVAALKLTKFIVFHVLLDTEKDLVTGKPNPLHLTTTNSFGVKLGIFVKANYNTPNTGISN